MAKQLWFNSLCDLTPERIREGTRRAIKDSEYLPSIHALRNYCTPRPEELGLPDAHRAYLEACRAPSPKAQHAWSHCAVYLAGKATDWFFLASNSENKAFPVFKQNYEILCERVMNGEQLDMPIVKMIPETVNTPLTNSERKQRMQALREELDI
jgi:Replication protein P